MRQTTVSRALALLVLILGMYAVHEAGPAAVDWAIHMLYSTSDWVLFCILTAVLIGGFWWFTLWLFRGVPVDDATKSTLHKITE